MKIFFAILGTLLTLAFLGVQPLADYKDTIMERIGYSHLESKESSPLMPNELKSTVTRELNGTYTSEFRGGIEESMTFKRNIVTKKCKLGNTKSIQICEYFIPGGLESGQVITFTDVATGEKTTHRFKYIAEYNCFVIGYGTSFPITYYQGR